MLNYINVIMASLDDAYASSWTTEVVFMAFMSTEIPGSLKMVNYSNVELLQCFHEADNPEDRYAAAMKKR